MPPFGMAGELVGERFIEAAIRYWDLAATRAELGKGDPDWTVGALVCRSARSVLRSGHTADAWDPEGSRS